MNEEESNAEDVNNQVEIALQPESAAATSKPKRKYVRKKDKADGDEVNGEERINSKKIRCAYKECTEKKKVILKHFKCKSARFCSRECLAGALRSNESSDPEFIPCEAVGCPNEGKFRLQRMNHVYFCSTDCYNRVFNPFAATKARLSASTSSATSTDTTAADVVATASTAASVPTATLSADITHNLLEQRTAAAIAAVAAGVGNAQRKRFADAGDSEHGKKKSRKDNASTSSGATEAAAGGAPVKRPRGRPRKPESEKAPRKAQKRVCLSRMGIRWTPEMDKALIDYGLPNWKEAAEHVGNGVTATSCYRRWSVVLSQENRLTNGEEGPTKNPAWTADEVEMLYELVPQHMTTRNGQPMVEWKTLAPKLGRRKEECSVKWMHLQRSAGMESKRTGPFSPEEDAIIIKRKEEWDAAGKKRGLWRILGDEFNRRYDRVQRRYDRLLVAQQKQQQQEQSLEQSLEQP